MSLSKRLRFEILTRDGHTCRYCGGQPPDVVLTVDHVLPVTLGGSDEPSNLCAACKDCNAGKSSVKPGSPMVEQISRDAHRWAVAIEWAVREKSIAIGELEQKFAQVDQAWQIWTYDGGKHKIPRDPGWRNTVEIWLKRGVTADMLAYYVHKAMANDRLAVGDVWRYYCGIIWKVVTQLDEQALSLVGEMDDADDLERADDVMALVF